MNRLLLIIMLLSGCAELPPPSPDLPKQVRIDVYPHNPYPNMDWIYKTGQNIPNLPTLPR